jgi:DNA-binding transcriptional LysR family regulator
MVQAGLGVAVMPASIAALYRRSLSLAVVSLDEEWAERELKICIRSFAALPGAARLLVEHLRRSAAP